MGANTSAENTPNAYLPNLSAQAQKFWISKKKGLNWAAVVGAFCNWLKNKSASRLREPIDIFTDNSQTK